jgi:hypothetical protein
MSSLNETVTIQKYIILTCTFDELSESIPFEKRLCRNTEILLVINIETTVRINLTFSSPRDHSLSHKSSIQ